MENISGLNRIRSCLSSIKKAGLSGICPFKASARDDRMGYGGAHEHHRMAVMNIDDLTALSNHINWHSTKMRARGQ